MKVGIIGTRGIPNHYGGFEQFAMFFAEYLVKEGMEVVVYNSSHHPYKKDNWNGVQIQHVYDPEHKIGTAGQFFYDLFSILDARKRDFDVIFQLGYTSSSVWGFLFPKKSWIITNMDGLEWKRTKYSKPVQSFLKKAESWAVKQSDWLIADSIGIQNYLQKKYAVSSSYIPYGATIFSENKPSVLEEFQLQPHQYNLVIARLEPENNVELVIQAHLESAHSIPLCIIGSCSTPHGKYLYEKYGQKVNFLGAIYASEKLNNLRFYARLYFHGHSVGGTNPSLLEAMACSCVIAAHQNEFNQAVLEKDAFYFKTKQDIEKLLQNFTRKEVEKEKIENNLEKIRTTFSFNSIHTQLKELIERTV